VVVSETYSLRLTLGAGIYYWIASESTSSFPYKYTSTLYVDSTSVWIVKCASCLDSKFAKNIAGACILEFARAINGKAATRVDIDFTVR
jgi:hypothetical protein